MGVYNGPDKPEALLNGQLKNTIASGWYPIASHQIDIELEPGESRTFVFVLGYAENSRDNKWEALNVINKKPAESRRSLLLPS